MAGGLAPLWVAAGWARLRGRNIRGMVRLLREHGWLGARLVRFVVLALTMTAFFGSFANWKSAIPLLYPGFPWDGPLETAEIWLHGDHPDRLLAPLFGSPGATLFLDRVYRTWFYMLFGLVIWQAWQADHRRLRQFWMAFALTWIVLGIFIAAGVASAGPIYAGLDRQSVSYNDLLARLDAAEALAPLFVRMSAWSLWEAARQPGVSIGDGISAFPSLHVAVAFLATLAMWRVHHLLGLIGASYTLLILVGSIMLGWHYALDGEAGIVGAAVLWMATGRWAKRADRSTPAPLPHGT
jgi:PAP2 superfamily